MKNFRRNECHKTKARAEISARYASSSMLVKRVFCVLLLAVCLTGLAACGEKEPEQAEIEQAETTPEPSEPPVAFLLSGGTEFANAVEDTAAPLVSAGGYRLLAYMSATPDTQEDDMYAAIGAGAKAIVILPVDVDNLQQPLDESDLMHIPIVNLMDPINGVVDVLISPDYMEMGRLAAQAAVAARPEGAHVLTIEPQDMPAQLTRDGFTETAAAHGGVEIVGSVIAGAHTDVHAAVAEKLAADESVNLVFAIGEASVADVVAAVQESGRDVQVVTTGGSTAVQEMIGAGTVYASVFASPYQLAEMAAECALALAGGGTVEVYMQLALETIDANNVAQYAAQGVYADLLNPVRPTQSPKPTEEPTPTATAAGETA